MFDSLNLYPEDPVLGLSRKFKENPHPEKINLGVGIYLDGEGKSTPFKAIKEAEKKAPSSHDYLPIEGDPQFLAAFNQLQGFDDDLIHVQSLGGTGALFLGAKLLREAGSQKIALSDPTWPNHPMIFERTPLEFNFYPYYDPLTKTLRIEEFLKFLHIIPSQTILLQLTCHNPTGVDPTLEEWQRIFDKMEEKGHIPFFDNAYQGFSAPFNQALEPLRIWLKKDRPFLMATSFSKNFGLYNDRIGVLTVKTSLKDKEKALSALKRWVRVTYSNPPVHGAFLIREILSNPVLKKMWEDELNERRERIFSVRQDLSTKIKGDFSFIVKQKGLFSLLGLSKASVDALEKEFGIVMMDSSRINLTGLNSKNLEKAAKAISSYV